MDTGPWVPAPLSPDDTFPLWGFDQGGRFGLTRGRTWEEAHQYVEGDFVSALPLNTPLYYGRNHDSDWYTRPMWWLCERLGLDPRDDGHVSRVERLRELLLQELLASEGGLWT